ncbi:hypothetical protein GGS26DRAFT_598702 [Hypomontagnella submonticulosa]|nr:hypothetical protein GGS26DRAFT_598702 [Hypomontagnella submonticulosa]
MTQLGMHPMVPEMISFLVTNSVVCFCAVVVVGLRFYSRYITKAGFGWDDGLTLASILVGINLLSVLGLLSVSGIGHPIAEIGDVAHLDILVKIITLHNLFFVLAVLTNKLSMLCFYIRIYSRNQTVCWAAKIFIVFFLVWGVICAISLYAICHPVLTRPGGNTCNRQTVFVHSSLLSLFGDIVVILLPIPAIWKLHMDRRTKVKLTVLFLLGIIVTIVSVARIVVLIRQDFRSPEFAIFSQAPLAYAVLEPNLGILCASLPMVHKLCAAWKAKLYTRDNPTMGSHTKSSQSETGY